MRQAISAAASLLLLVGGFVSRGAESTWEFSVQVSASVDSVPPTIRLSWPQDTYLLPNSYTVFRKTPAATSWGQGTALPGTSTGFIDTNVTVGSVYEYQIVKKTSQYTGYGYLYSGIEAPLIENRGKLLLIVDNTYAANLTNELARLQEDLVGDGWTVARLGVNRDDSVFSVKNLIRNQYLADPANVKAVLLFGHVPVPYSGNIVPDGHVPDHQGAWPCDGYYGDIDGIWTDTSVNTIASSDARTRNLPGDGKFDQSTFPAPIKLMIGRVDLANMPGRLTWGGEPTFPSELELLRNYLNKNHKFRHKEFDLPRRGVVGDYFGVRNGEAFAASGWRNLSSFFGASNLSNLPVQGTWIPTLSTNASLWAYGCGSGSYTSIGGLGNTDIYHDGITTEMVSHDIKTVFAMLFGSWLGDWDSEDNIQRSILALPSYGLACAWSGRPHWFLQHMALGETIGFGARLTQNNTAAGLYQNQVNSCAGQIHIALMGDPSLRMHIVAPPNNVEISTNGAGFNVSWAPSPDAVLGYHVYRAAQSSGPFTRLTSNPINKLSFFDAAAPASPTYMVRAVLLETSSSGSYFNASQGILRSLSSSGNMVAQSGPKATNAAVITITSPVANSVAYGPALQISATASHPAGVASVQFKLDGTNLGSELTSAPYEMTWDTRAANGGSHVLTAVGRDNTGNKALSAPVTFTLADVSPSNDGAGTNFTWVDEALPTGAISAAEGGDGWNWVGSDPAPVSGKVAHRSNISSGLHQHFFTSASPGLTIGTGDVLHTYVYIDPNNLPSELMLQWYDGSWEHRAFWGANQILNGVNGTASRRYMGTMPAPGQWVRLSVPAQVVGLEGSKLTGMAFTLYGGRASWDAAGKTSAAIVTNPTTNLPPVVSSNTPVSPTTPTGGSSLPGISVVDYANLELPNVGSNTLHVLTPNLLELKLISNKPRNPARVSHWDWVSSDFEFNPPSLNSFVVTANGQPVTVSKVGFKRRPLYAPLASFDLRIENSLYLELSAPLADGQSVEVKNPNGNLWNGSMQFAAVMDPLRFSPAVHVNQEGYMPNYDKKAMVGYYAGSLGEVAISAGAGFKIVQASTGIEVFQGPLTLRPDVGYTYTPTPYQKVYEADFTEFNTPGEYRLMVPGLGASLPFVIHEGVGLAFARAYALGLYHQRCGTNNVHPHTRFTHDVCHAAPASVPMPAADFSFTWNTISNYTRVINSNNEPQTAPQLTGPANQLFPFVRQGQLEVSGGHHDAGDYSKYTANSASFVHYLMFAVDSLPGVAALDNLGLPESGDGISDVLQEAKWEADFLAKIQDTDGGFYFLVYPRNREYESGVLPENGDPQVVWPKTTSVTAASVAALAQCASSAAFKQAYPATAALYLQKAQLGWQFLTNSFARYGKNGGYQKITHYADDFADKDELAWAACQMYLATGDPAIHQLLMNWFDPADPTTWRWGWWHMSQCYGHAIRSYAFAVQSGRMNSASQLNAGYLAKCQAQIAAAGEDVLTWSRQSAYGTSISGQSKRVRAAGWYFSTDQAFDVTVAYQLLPKPEYINALIANMNYEGGCNPVNVCYVTGLGWKRQRDIVSGYAPNDRRLLPPSGIPVGNVQSGFAYVYTYESELPKLCFPSDEAPTAPYPFYDRWGDSWNVTAEFVILNSARSLASLSFLAAQTSLKNQPWKAAVGQISVPSSVVKVGNAVTVSLQVPGMDLNGARIVWEARDQEPAFGPTFSFSPRNNGAQWIEAEAQWPDGRRVFASASFNANSPDIVWIDDALPAGAVPGAEGGDSWNWIGSPPAPISGSLSHQSANGSGVHQHFFDNATATLAIEAGDTLYAYVYLDPLNPPSTIMLQWNNGSWDHRAYWGSDNLNFGQNGTASRRFMGPLPVPGQWVQLKVPANAVGLENSVLKGMAFTAYGGRASWDAAGRLSSMSTVPNSSLGLSLSMTPAGPKLRWNTVANRIYEIAYKNNLNDFLWTTMNELRGTGSPMEWVDPSASSAKQRFYAIREVE